MIGFTARNAGRNIIFPIIIFIVVFMVIYNVVYFTSAIDTTITVTKTDRIVESSGSGKDLTVTSKYLVYTTDETFENTDAIFFGKYNSSDFQGKLLPNKTYKVKVIGWRLPFFSTYRNIVKIY